MQDVATTAMLRMAIEAKRLTGEDDLCLAGGLALNCVANGVVQREGPFERVWVQPAAGDAGSALGAALWFWHDQEGNARTRVAGLPDAAADAMAGSFLGPAFADDEVSSWLETTGIAHQRIPDPAALSETVAARLAAGDVVGWFQGAMEFGPRALGHRSILADPRSPTVHRELNLRVKGRESFRPFAPAVLWEEATAWFELDAPSPYMLATVQVRAERRVEVAEEPVDLAERATVVRSQIPACTHVDGSARVQTVHEATNPGFHRLLRSFESATGCPVLLNTSFNVAGDPIVCTPADAVTTAAAAGLDLLVLGNALVERAELARLVATNDHSEVGS